MSESTLYNEIRMALAPLGARVFRNNVGLFDTRDGRKVRTGLCVGSSDLIGWTRDGRFLAIEVKAPGRAPTPEQANFLREVASAGGVAFVAYSADDARAKLIAGLQGTDTATLED